MKTDPGAEADTHDEAIVDQESEADGDHWHAIEVGAGPSVVFLHGLFGSATIWRDVVDRVAVDWRCVAVDLPGHGESAPLPEGSTAADLLGDLEQLIETLGVESPVLVGHGLGARLSAALTRRVVNVAALVGIAPERPSAGVAARVDGLRDPDFVDSYFPSLFAEEFFFEQPGRADEQRRKFEAIDPDQLVTLAAAVDAVDPGLMRVDGLTVPAAVIMGDRDHSYTTPDVRTEVIPGAGHMLPVEVPESLGVLVAGFLERELVTI